MPTVLITVEKYGVALSLCDFSQLQFEKYQEETIKAAKAAYISFSPDTGVSATAMVRGETVRSAIRNKIVANFEVADVDGLKPYLVEWMADEIRKHVTQVTTAPADPN